MDEERRADVHTIAKIARIKRLRHRGHPESPSEGAPSVSHHHQQQLGVRISLNVGHQEVIEEADSAGHG